jgi:hypothetical protein
MLYTDWNCSDSNGSFTPLMMNSDRVGQQRFARRTETLRHLPSRLSIVPAALATEI